MLCKSRLTLLPSVPTETYLTPRACVCPVSYTIGFIFFSHVSFLFIERNCYMANLPTPACCVPSDPAEVVYALLDNGDCKLTLAELQEHDAIADAEDGYWKPFATKGVDAAHDIIDHDGDQIVSPAEFAVVGYERMHIPAAPPLGSAAAESSILILAVGIGNFLTMTLIGEISDCFGRKKALYLPPLGDTITALILGLYPLDGNVVGLL